MEILLIWWNFHYWLYQKLSFEQLSVQPVINTNADILISVDILSTLNGIDP